MSKKIDIFKQEQLNVLQETLSFQDDCLNQIKELQNKQNELRNLMNTAMDAMNEEIETLLKVVSASKFNTETVSMKLKKEPLTEYQYEVQYHALRNNIGRVFQATTEYPDVDVNLNPDDVTGMTKELDTDTYYTRVDTAIKDPDEASGFQDRADVQDENSRPNNTKGEETTERIEERIISSAPDVSNNGNEKVEGVVDVVAEHGDLVEDDSIDLDDYLNLDDFNDLYCKISEQSNNAMNSEIVNPDNAGVSVTDTPSIADNSTEVSVNNVDTDDNSDISNNEKDNQSGNNTVAVENDTASVKKPATSERVIPPGVAAFKKSTRKVKI